MDMQEKTAVKCVIEYKVNTEFDNVVHKRISMICRPQYKNLISHNYVLLAILLYSCTSDIIVGISHIIWHIMRRIRELDITNKVVCSLFSNYIKMMLTHLSLVPHICVNELGQHQFRKWLVAYPAPSHYLNQCWVIDNWTLRNKPQWNSNQNTTLSIHENASENIVCEAAAILSRGRWVNALKPSDVCMRHYARLSLVQTMGYPLFGTKTLQN